MLLLAVELRLKLKLADFLEVKGLNLFAVPETEERGPGEPEE